LALAGANRWNNRNQPRKENTMYIQEILNKHGATVYHVEDEGCIQEFWSKEQAQEYIDYVKEIYSHWEEV